MFEYFTGPKYVWNLGVCATLNNGGAIDEVDRACRPAREAPEGPSMWPIAAGVLAILALLALGAQRELGRPRWWRVLHIGG